MRHLSPFSDRKKKSKSEQDTTCRRTSLPLLPLTSSMANITHSITSNSAKTTKNSKSQSDIVGNGYKKGVTHIQRHPMTQVLRELPLPKVEITIAYFNDDAARAESIIGLGSKGKIRLLLYFVNV